MRHFKSERQEFNIGDKVGIFTYLKETIGYTSPKTGKHERRIICLCECGKEIKGSLFQIKNKASCNHVGVNKRNNHLVTHGMSKSILYSTYSGIKTRCYNEKVKNFPAYGGRGIIMQKSWISSFIEFKNYVTSLPNYDEKRIGNKKHCLTIDRIDVNGNYEEGNLRWATWKVQLSNRRPKKIGIRFHIRELKSGHYQLSTINNLKKISLGTYTTELEAIIVKDNYKKENPNLNFI